MRPAMQAFPPVSRCAAGALIGTWAKRATEIGAPSLKHPFARVFVAVVAATPLANSEWRNKVI